MTGVTLGDLQESVRDFWSGTCGRWQAGSVR
jgi:hypothetical protein